MHAIRDIFTFADVSFIPKFLLCLIFRSLRTAFICTYCEAVCIFANIRRILLFIDNIKPVAFIFLHAIRVFCIHCISFIYFLHSPLLFPFFAFLWSSKIPKVSSHVFCCFVFIRIFSLHVNLISLSEMANAIDVHFDCLPFSDSLMRLFIFTRLFLSSLPSAISQKEAE